MSGVPLVGNMSAFLQGPSGDYLHKEKGLLRTGLSVPGPPHEEDIFKLGKAI